MHEARARQVFARACAVLVSFVRYVTAASESLAVMSDVFSKFIPYIQCKNNARTRSKHIGSTHASWDVNFAGKAEWGSIGVRIV